MKNLTSHQEPQEQLYSSRNVYFVQETQRTADGAYKVCVVSDGISGYSLTDWEWDCSFEEAEKLAKRFHETYEKLAPLFGYETRQETKEFDENSPNGKLMIAVCGKILEILQAQKALEEK